MTAPTITMRTDVIGPLNTPTTANPTADHRPESRHERVVA
jgi:hypothetical protein